MNSGATSPETSVVIRTYNEEKHLPGLLTALAEQAYTDFETIVVDSGSTDQTRHIAAAHARVLRIERANFTFGYSLNVGVRDARGRFIAIVSAHTLPCDAGWLGRLIDPLREPNVAMVYGRQLGLPGTSKYGEIQDLRRLFGPDRQVLLPPHIFANNANSAIRKELWAQHNFDEALPGLEDIAWAQHWGRLGYAAVYEPDAALYHIHEESWAQLEHRYYREAVAQRHLGLTSRLDIPRVILSETKWAVVDLLRAVSHGDMRRGAILATTREIFRFRATKVLGTTRGLWDGSALSGLERETYYFNHEYRRVVITGRNHSALETHPVPTTKPGEVLIRVAYAGVCATDLEILDGTLGYYADGTAQYPIVPGHELSGWVAAIGANVSGFDEGDRVVVECIQSCGSCSFCQHDNQIACQERKELGVIGRDGGYAEYVIAEGRFLHPIPEHVDLRTAALAEPLAVVLKGLRRLARAWPDRPTPKNCAVVGVGPIGHLAALVLQQWGNRVTVIDRNPTRLSYFDGSGISTSHDVRQIEGFDALVEVTGDSDALDTMLRLSAPGTPILLLGLPYAHRSYSFEDIVAYDKMLIGSVGSGAVHFREALRLLPNLRLDPFFDHVVPLEHYKDCWTSVRNATSLKTILVVSPVDSLTRPTARVRPNERAQNICDRTDRTLLGSRHRADTMTKFN